MRCESLGQFWVGLRFFGEGMHDFGWGLVHLLVFFWAARAGNALTRGLGPGAGAAGGICRLWGRRACAHVCVVAAGSAALLLAVSARMCFALRGVVLLFVGVQWGALRGAAFGRAYIQRRVTGQSSGLCQPRMK